MRGRGLGSGVGSGCGVHAARKRRKNKAGMVFFFMVGAAYQDGAQIEYRTLRDFYENRDTIFSAVNGC